MLDMMFGWVTTEVPNMDYNTKLSILKQEIFGSLVKKKWEYLMCQLLPKRFKKLQESKRFLMPVILKELLNSLWDQA